MIRIMLVDDNKLALEYFSALVDWNACGYELVGTAVDGSAALILFEKLHPQVVITDVQMPRMDGIALAGEIRRRAPGTVIVFLSSYEEFSYIRSAMQLNVSEYILKHEMKAPLLMEKLAAIRSQIETRRVEERYIGEGYLEQMVREEPGETAGPSPSSFPGRYDLCLIQQAQILEPLGQIFEVREALPPDRAVRSCLYAQGSVRAVVSILSDMWLVLSFTGEDDIASAYRRKAALEEAFAREFRFLLLERNASIEECIRTYRQWKSTFPRLVFFPPSSVVYPVSLKKPGQSPPAGEASPSLEASPSREEKGRDQIRKALEKGDYPAVFQQMDRQLMQAIREQDTEGLREALRLYGELLHGYHQKLADYGRGEVFEAWQQEDISRWRDAAGVFSWFREQYSRLTLLLAERDLRGYSPLVAGAELFIYRNFRDCELTAEKIAGHFGCGINQLNAHMKKETGSTVWQLLIQVRMKKARSLLDTTHLPVSEIARRVGYNSVSYFSTVFRKSFGMSPQDYRRG